MGWILLKLLDNGSKETETRQREGAKRAVRHLRPDIAYYVGYTLNIREKFNH